MTAKNRTDLSELKQHYRRVEKACQQQDILWKERHEVEKSLELLIEIEDPSREKLRQRKLEIDHLLDQIEEDTEEQLDKLREQLVEVILIEHPDQVNVYQELNRSLTRQRQAESCLLTIIDHSEATSFCLQEAIAPWDSSLLQRILGFIFTGSPAVITSKALAQAGKQSEQAIEAIDVYEKDSETQLSCLQQLRLLFSALVVEAPQSWDFKKLRTTFTDTRETLNALIRKIEAELETSHERVVELELEMSKWLDSYLR